MLSSRMSIAPRSDPQDPREEEDAATPDSRRAIAGGIVHDLNNVFSSFSIATQLLQEDLPVERRRTLLASLAQATRRGQKLLDELERHGDREDGASIEIDVQVLLEAVVRAARRRLDGSRTLSTEYASGLPRVVGDPDALFGLVYSTLLQAASTSPEGSAMSLSCRLHRAPDDANTRPPLVEIAIDHTAHGGDAPTSMQAFMGRLPLPAATELERLAESRWTVRVPARVG